MPRADFRLYLITDRKLVRQSLPTVCEAVLQAAAEVRTSMPAIQLREKDLDAKPMLELALALREICNRFGALLLISERVDVAIAAGADGVHLPADSIGPAAARRLLGPQALIGVSTHSRAEIVKAAEQGADFAVFGPVFTPISKASYSAAVGRDGLAAACRNAPIPIFGLGGVNAERAARLSGAGAHGVALIGAVMAAADPAEAALEILRAVGQWQNE